LSRYGGKYCYFNQKKGVLPAESHFLVKTGRQLGIRLYIGEDLLLGFHPISHRIKADIYAFVFKFRPLIWLGLSCMSLLVYVSYLQESWLLKVHDTRKKVGYVLNENHFSDFLRHPVYTGVCTLI
jgi:hypothetical protein